MWLVSVQKGWSASWGSVRKARKGTLLDVQWRTVWSLTSNQPHGWWVQNWEIRQCDKNCQPLLDHTTHIQFPLFIPCWLFLDCLALKVGHSIRSHSQSDTVSSPTWPESSETLLWDPQRATFCPEFMHCGQLTSILIHTYLCITYSRITNISKHTKKKKMERNCPNNLSLL